MGGKQTSSLLFKDKPVFGLDIGFSTVKVMQIDHSNKGKNSVVGYGFTNFDSKAIKDGVIIDPEAIAKPIQELFDKGLAGHINTRRVVMSIPATRTFAKTMSLPALQDKELKDAVALEAQQYIPMPIDQLYIDYTVVDKTKDGIEVLTVGVPKDIVDSFFSLARILGLEPVAFDTTTGAAGRLFENQHKSSEIPAVLIDFGSLSADITIHDKTVIVSSTASSGGDIFTDLIAKKLGVTGQEAYVIKSKYGLGKSKKQKEILEAVSPELDKLVREIKRMIRYYEERSDSKSKIGQIVTMGGGANMPGLSGYLTETLRLPVRMCDPWLELNLGRLKKPTEVEKSLFVIVAGLAFVDKKEIFT